MSNHNRLFQIAIVGIYLVVFFIISQNLGYQYLMFDEAVQFWISKGLNPDSEPLSKTGGVLAVVENNKYYNMDPGGFGILLHFWAGISDHYTWLRILPFLFFIGVVISFGYLSFKWVKNLNIALLIGLVPILYPMTLTMGFEIRAYSMETLGTLLCIVSFEKLKTKLTYKNLFLWGSILAIFMTSRYSMIIVVFVASLYFLHLISREAIKFKSKILLALVYGLPISISLGLIYFNALIYQNTNLSPLIYVQYLRDVPALLITPQAMLYLSSVLFLIFIYFLKNKYPRIKKYEGLLFTTIVVNLVFLVLSFLGKHPWVPPFSFRASRCISMITLVFLCFSAVLGEILSWFTATKNKAINYAIIGLLIGIIFLKRDSLMPRIIPLKIKETESSYAILNNVQLDFGKNNIDTMNKIYVDWGNSPYIRYWYEYGPLRSEIGKSYPMKFTFTKTGRHGFYEGAKDVEFFKGNKNHTESKALDQYDLVIAGKSPEKDKWKLMDSTFNFWIKQDSFSK